jgi:hypothetical protein
VISRWKALSPRLMLAKLDASSVGCGAARRHTLLSLYCVTSSWSLLHSLGSSQLLPEVAPFSSSEPATAYKDFQL